MKSKFISDKKKNALYNAPINSIATIGFREYLGRTSPREFKLIANSSLDEYIYILQSQCKESIFKVKLVNEQEIELLATFHLALFIEGRLPNEEYFRRGQVYWIKSETESALDETANWKYTIPTVSDIDCKL